MVESISQNSKTKKHPVGGQESRIGTGREFIVEETCREVAHDLPTLRKGEVKEAKMSPPLPDNRSKYLPLPANCKLYKPLFSSDPVSLYS